MYLNQDCTERHLLQIRHVLLMHNADYNNPILDTFAKFKLCITIIPVIFFYFKMTFEP